MNLGPYHANSYVVGDCRELLRALPDESVNCAVTSPPYWGLRDYGTATWKGGNPKCAHLGRQKPRNDTSGGTNGRFCETHGTQDAKAIHSIPVRGVCSCGAKRIDAQLGLEETPEEYIANMVEVFREVRRVLRSDGTCWINIGDTYSREPQKGDNSGWGKHAAISDLLPGHDRATGGLPPKNLVGIPWMLAFALRADGWYLRQEIIWHKLNVMPESVKDRPTRDHEQLFLFSKSPTYYYDYKAIQEPTSGTAHARGNGVNPKAVGGGENPPSGLRKHGPRAKQNASFSAAVSELVDVRNKRSVWSLISEPTPDAHFATYPTKLVEPCILAGCPAGGVVLDPFGGSGTTGRVAEDLGRQWLLFDLSPEYEKIAKRKTAQVGLLGRIA